MPPFVVRRLLPHWVKICLSWLLSRSLVGAAIRLLRLPVRHRGLKVELDDPCISHQTLARLAFGLYEGAETRLLHRYAPVGIDCVVDLGCSLGIVGSHLGRFANAAGTYIGVEANPALHKGAERRLKANFPPGWRIDVVWGAAVAQDDGTPIRLEVGSNTANSRIVSMSTPSDVVRDVVLPALTPGALIARLPPSRGKAVLICDIEGAEWEYLAAAPNLVSRFDLLIVELHNDMGRDWPYWHWYERIGCRCIARDGNVVALRPVQR